MRHAADSWRVVHRRKTGKKSHTKMYAKKHTILKAGRILSDHRIPPILWYWWGWGRDDFHTYKRGVKSKNPVFMMFWQPDRVEHLAPYFHIYRDDSWRKSPPKRPVVDALLKLRSQLYWAMHTSRPLTVADAQSTLDAICTEEEYARKLQLANDDVAGLMASEAADLSSCLWVWG